MIRYVAMWFILFLLFTFGVSTYRSWTKQAAWSISKWGLFSFIGATLTTALLGLIVVLF